MDDRNRAEFRLASHEEPTIRIVMRLRDEFRRLDDPSSIGMLDVLTDRLGESVLEIDRLEEELYGRS